VDHERARLRDLSRRLVRLHGLLLDRERQAYERRHGAIPPGSLFNLLLHDPQFAWLRALSGMVARIDEQVDADEPLVPEAVERLFREAYRLLKSDDRSAFHDKYLDALQDSPDVVMAHADVSKVLTA